MLSKYITAATCLLAAALAQTPPGYTWANSDSPIYLKYYGFPIFPAGSVLPWAEPYYEPQVYASSPLNGTYLLFLVDSNYNNSAAIPAEVLWIASGVTFKQTPTAVIGQTGSVYPALTSDSSKVPYLAPSVPGHTYIALLYHSPPNFKFPPNFPYNATFRSNFNVTRIGADFKSPVLEATYFSVKSNHSTPQPSGTGAHGSGYAAPTASVFAPNASFAPFTGSANAVKKVGEAWTWTRTLATLAVTGAVIISM